MVPASLGEFAIEGLLGEGGSSLVYAARRGDEELALKVLHPDLGLSPRETERFLAEAERLRAVRHPAIVELRAAGVLPDGRPYLAMPRLRGRSLASRLADGPLSASRAVALFDGVADAVATLHRAGLIHRDIKPENVLWLDEDDRLVLLDLGIARDAEGAPSTTTRAGLARGTPRYMAPERLFGQRASVRTDVYELALLLYVMLAGSAPWRDDDPQGRLSPSIDPKLVAALPEGLVATLGDALALDVARRPASVDELVGRVRACAPALGISAVARSGERLSDTRLVVTPRGPVAADPSFALAPTELHATPRALSVDAAAEAHPTLRSASQPPGARRRRGAAFAVGGLALLSSVGGTYAVVAWRRAHAPSRPDASSTATTTETTTPTRPPSLPSTEPAPSAASPPAPSASPPSPTTQPTASGAPRPAPTSVATVAPTSTAVPAGSASGVAGPMPASCAALIQLVCAPGSSGTPEECAAWRGNVARWRTSLPSTTVDTTCQSALDTSRSGLAARKNTKIPR